VLSDFDEVQALRPRSRASSTPNTYSGNFGFDAFPLHTDLAHWARPPRYLALRCMVGMAEVATLVLDGNDLVAEIGATSMRRALVQPRRRLGGVKALLRLRECIDGFRSLIRWDGLFLRPATVSSRETCRAVTTYLCSVMPRRISLLNAGDTLILDNWRML